jgi:hypothetical protein
MRPPMLTHALCHAVRLTRKVGSVMNSIVVILTALIARVCQAASIVKPVQHATTMVRLDILTENARTNYRYAITTYIILIHI